MKVYIVLNKWDPYPFNMEGVYKDLESLIISLNAFEFEYYTEGVYVKILFDNMSFDKIEEIIRKYNLELRIYEEELQ